VEPYSPFRKEILNHEEYRYLCFRVIRILVHDPIESGCFPEPYLQFRLF
jgi:hypothetical protein